MIRTLAAAFLICILQLSLVGFASEEGGRSGCDIEVSTPSRAYLSLVRKGLAMNAFSTEDALWAADQKVPTSPLRTHKSIENVFFKRSLEKALRLIKDDVWSAVGEDIRTLVAEINHEKGVVHAAEKATASIYQLRPLGIFAQTATAIGEADAESVSVYADVSPGGMETTVQRLGEVEKIPLDGHTGTATEAGFFRASDGRIFYATLFDCLLRVSDISIRKPLFALDLTGIPEVVAIETSARRFRPLMFEMNGRVKVALVPKSLNTHVGFGKNKFAVIVDVLSGEVALRSFANRRVWYKRLAQDRLFAFGQDEDDHLSILDLGKNNVVFRTEWKVSDYTDDENFTLDLHLDHRGQPQMSLSDFEANIRKLRLVNKEGLDEIGRMRQQLDFWNLSTFGDSTGKLWVTKVNTLKGGATQVTIGQPGAGSVTFDSIQLDRLGEVKGLKIMETRDGLKIALWEWNLNLGVVIGIHILDVQTQSVQSVPIPERLNLIKPGAVAYDAQSNTINAFLKSEQGRWQLYQVFGPPDRGDVR